MKPSLKSLNINVLRFRVRLTLPDDLLTRIQQVAPPDDEGDSLFVDSYKIGNFNHRTFVWVMRPRGKSERHDIGFIFEVGRAGKLNKKAARVDSLVEILSSIKTEMDFQCNATFIFKKRQKVRTLIDLPLKISTFSGLPFDYIEGVNFVKRGDGQEQYGVILDRMLDGELFSNVTFNYKTKFRDSLADDIAGEAVRICDSFVLKG